jgi:methionyl-tRNA formyltransferase
MPLRFERSISQLSAEHDVPVLRLESIKSSAAVNVLRGLALDLIVLGGGWPERIPERVIEMPPLGIISTHPSLLPRFRGTDVHRWQVMHGVKRSGSTIHYVDAELDTGAILGTEEVEISPEDTPQDLAAKSGVAAGPLMVRVLDAVEQAAPGRARGHRTGVSRGRDVVLRSLAMGGQGISAARLVP